MLLTKLWLFLVTLLSGLLFLCLLLLLPSLRDSSVESLRERLHVAQRTTGLLLAGQAHRLVAGVGQAATTPTLRTSLAEMGRGQAELSLLHQTAQADLRTLQKKLAVAFLFAVDARGRVLARAGLDEAVYRDPIDGWPVVEAALRGYYLDDLWLLDGVLYRVAAAPVIDASQDRHVGALIAGIALGSELAEELHSTTGVDIAFLVRGKVLGTSRPGLADAATLRATQPTGPGPLPWPSPGSEGLVAYVPLPGEAAAQGAEVALIVEPAIPSWEGASGSASSPRALLQAAAARGLKLSWLFGLLGGMALIFGIGLSLIYLEAERPRLRRPVSPP